MVNQMQRDGGGGGYAADEIEFEPESWRTAGQEIASVGTDIEKKIGALLDATGDVGRLGATGNNLLDPLLAGIIPAYQGMVREWIGKMSTGLASEGDMLGAAADYYEMTETTNEVFSEEIAGQLEGL